MLLRLRDACACPLEGNPAGNILGPRTIGREPRRTRFAFARCRYIPVPAYSRGRRLEEHLGVALYFAKLNYLHQRGANEHANALIRQCFPKGIDFQTITHAKVRAATEQLHNRPRVGVGYRTINEGFCGISPCPTVAFEISDSH